MASGMQAGSSELRISDLQGAVQKESPDVYVTFRLGNEHAETPVIKNAGETLHWSEPISITAGRGGRDTNTLIVRAYDKQALMPDALLGEARVNLSEQSLGDSSVAGSGGGANVQVQLLGKRSDFGGELRFTLTGTEGLSVPGGTEWGPQEVHDKQGAGLAAGALGAGAAGGMAAHHTGDHGTTGFQGGGASAFPAQDSGKLQGEHLSDFDKNTAGEHGTTGFGGGGATARPAEESGRDLKGERLSDFEGQGGQGTYGTTGTGTTGTHTSGEGQQGGGIVDKLRTAIGFGPGDSIVTDKGAGGHLETEGQTGTGYSSEHQGNQGPSLTEKLQTAIGFGPKDSIVTDKGGHNAQAGIATTGQPTSEYSSGQRSADTQGESLTEKLKSAVGLGAGQGGHDAQAGIATTEQPTSEYSSGQRSTGTQGESLTEKFKSAVGLGTGQEHGSNTTGGLRDEGYTTGTGTQQLGSDRTGELRDTGYTGSTSGQQTRGDVATAPGAAPGASYKTAGSAATAGAVAAGSGYGDEGTTGYGDSQSDEQRKGGLFLATGAAGLTGDGGLDSKHAPGSDGAGITTTETATGPSTMEQMTPGATATDAGMMPDTGITTSYTSAGDTGTSTGGMGHSGSRGMETGMETGGSEYSGTGTEYSGSRGMETGMESGGMGHSSTGSGTGGGVAKLRMGGLDHQHADGEHGKTATLRHGTPDPLTVEGHSTGTGTGTSSGMSAGTGTGTGMGMGTGAGVGAGGPAPGTTISAKDLASESTKRDWAAADNAPLAGDTVSDARQPLPPTATSSGMRTGSSDAGGDGTLRVSGIRAKLAREEDLLGHVTPYLMFEVGRHTESTETKKKGVRHGEELAWDQELTIDTDASTDAELHIIAYDKKKLVSDSRLGEARAPLSQLPRGRTARLNLVDHRTFGNIAGHVDFTLSGGGAGGEGAGNDTGMVEGAHGLAPISHEAAARGGGGGDSDTDGGRETF